MTLTASRVFLHGSLLGWVDWQGPGLTVQRPGSRPSGRSVESLHAV